MGRLYSGSGTFTLNPENTLATFEGGTVYSPAGALSTGHETLMYYDGGRIYRHLDEAIAGSPVVLARCDEFGRIKSADGVILGYCENGEVKNRSGQGIAYYEGDMYGAAAAACAVLFGVGAKKANPAPGPNTNGGDRTGAELVFSILGLALLNAGKLLRKLIKTIHFWGPYVFTLVLSCVVAAPAVSIIALLPILLYLILHTILLLKCRKRQGKDKYRPLVISFLLYLVSFLLLGIPAVIYQIVWLVRDRKKNQAGGTGI